MILTIYAIGFVFCIAGYLAFEWLTSRHVTPETIVVAVFCFGIVWPITIVFLVLAGIVYLSDILIIRDQKP